MKINPQGLAIYSEFWLYEKGMVRDLHFDPKEWVWNRQGPMEETHFFDCKTKRGYRIILQDISVRLKFDQCLEGRGYSGQQRKDFFLTLWHPWLPRKVSMMVWLIIADGLPVGEWRRKIGHSGLCNLCTEGVLQTSKHAFFECEAVRPVWV